MYDDGTIIWWKYWFKSLKMQEHPQNNCYFSVYIRRKKWFYYYSSETYVGKAEKQEEEKVLITHIHRVHFYKSLYN
jgi:hypothetical protein